MNRQREQIDQAVQDKAIADLHATGMTQTAIAKQLGVSQPTVSLACTRNKKRDLRDAVLHTRDHRAEMLTKYDKAEADIQRLLNELIGRLFPADAKLPKPNKQDLLSLGDAFGRLLDRKLKIYSQVADLLGLKTLNVNDTRDIGPNTLAAIRHINAGSNGDRAKVAGELLAYVPEEDRN